MLPFTTQSFTLGLFIIKDEIVQNISKHLIVSGRNIKEVFILHMELSDIALCLFFIGRAGGGGGQSGGRRGGTGTGRGCEGGRGGR